MDQNIAVPYESMRGSVGSTVQANQCCEEECLRDTMELFSENLCELVSSYKHIYDVTSPGQEDKDAAGG